MPDQIGPKQYVFILLDQFTMLCFSSAVEALRIANRMSGKQLYTWTLAGEGGDVAWCSAGIGFKLDCDLPEITRLELNPIIVSGRSLSVVGGAAWCGPALIRADLEARRLPG